MVWLRSLSRPAMRTSSVSALLLLLLPAVAEARAAALLRAPLCSRAQVRLMSAAEDDVMVRLDKLLAERGVGSRHAAALRALSTHPDRRHPWLAAPCSARVGHSRLCSAAVHLCQEARGPPDP